MTIPSRLVPPAVGVPEPRLESFSFERDLVVPGAADRRNPLYNRELSIADRLLGAKEFLSDYCRSRQPEIDLISDRASRIAALEELKLVLKLILALREHGPEVIRTIDRPMTIKALSGTHLVDADAKIFAGRDIGTVPAMPDNIDQILKARCELANDGRIIAETHRLVLIPASIDGVPTSIKSLCQFRGHDREVQPRTFFDLSWCEDEEFVTRHLRHSRWVLMFQGMAPGTGGKTEDQQIESIQRFENYETIGALEAAAVLVFGYLEHGLRGFEFVWCRTYDSTSSGERVDIGHFLAEGLDVNARSAKTGLPSLGIALCRRFNNTM